MLPISGKSDLDVKIEASVVGTFIGVEHAAAMLASAQDSGIAAIAEKAARGAAFRQPSPARPIA
jgi:hypothetical protein